MKKDKNKKQVPVTKKQEKPNQPIEKKEDKPVKNGSW